MIKSILSVVTGALNPNNDRTASASFTANSQSVELECNGLSAVGIQTRGTFVAQMAIQGLTDPNGTWETILAARRSTTGLTGSITATNQQYVVPVGGLYKLRVIVTSYTSGTVELYMNGSSGHGVSNSFIIGTSNGPVGSTQSGVWNVSLLDGTRRTYTASIVGLTAAAAATDIFTLTGSATTTVRVIRLSVAATKTTESMQDLVILKRSTANTGGTSTAPTTVSHDSADAAGTATPLAYTANPTVGTLVGIVQAEKLFFCETTKAILPNKVEYHYGAHQGKSIVLRGVNEVLAVNLNGKTVTGSSINIDITWTEE